jgi:hypothetical protein
LRQSFSRPRSIQIGWTDPRRRKSRRALRSITSPDFRGSPARQWYSSQPPSEGRHVIPSSGVKGGILFTAAVETLRIIAADPRHQSRSREGGPRVRNPWSQEAGRRSRGSSSQETRRWREMNSNHRSPARKSRFRWGRRIAGDRAVSRFHSPRSRWVGSCASRLMMNCRSASSAAQKSAMVLTSNFTDLTINSLMKLTFEV